MEHFAKAAENLVASLDDDDEVIYYSVLLSLAFMLKKGIQKNL